MAEPAAPSLFAATGLGQGLERAQNFSGIFGGPEELRKTCEGVLAQYKAAFP